MKRPRTALESALDAATRPLGFSNKKSSWYRQSDDVFQLITLQKSNYGDQYCINIGIFLKALGSERSLREQDCHVRIRATRIVPQSEEAVLATLLNLEAALEDGSRASRVVDILQRHLVPFLNLGATTAGIQSLFKEGRLASAMISGEARAFLSSQSS